MASKNRQVWIGALLIAALGVAWYRSQVYSGPPPKDRPQLILMTGGSSPYWQLIANGAEASAKANNADLEVKLLENDEDVEGQIKLLAKMEATEADGVALSPLDAQQQTRFINELAGDSVVVTVDSDAPLSNRLCYIGASNYAAGSMCAELVEQAIPAGGKVAVLVANLTKNNVLERKQALEESLQGGESDTGDTASNFQIVAVLQDEGDLARCTEQLTETLTEHDDLACIVGLNSYHAAQILKVLEAQQALDKVKVISFDTEDATLEGVEQGHIYATVAQDPYQYGYEAVRWLADNCQRSGNQLPLVGTRSTVHISTQAIRAEDVQKFREQYQKLLGEPVDSK
ncbi:substrate-binding domain-containing protein [Aeoliella sp. ICT_H6.2]|uniref:Substrate-binding domain-containing protein n=1 Tax=Aeoliella straminimaris TaxID=2954799 RepID=A0A9X2FAU9_9BACT|nr:substrate-binding domain-containing protein [Aeoliella straminimaris]MCO6045465.1 substrate-binding domain-containing protein [Aeoliella straminimaris]